MNICALHPLDHAKLSDLAEMLCDLSDGRASPDEARRRVGHLTSSLMMCTRDDCRADGWEVVAKRILGLADWRLGREGMMGAALVEILLGDAGAAIK
ncbi:MAG: hypothetical protein ACR65X_13040 [Methylocystis sp.]